MIDLVDGANIICAICDFGMSRVIGDKRQIVIGLIDPGTFGFTVRYAAPEVFT